jgi:hypothetical protein
MTSDLAVGELIESRSESRCSEPSVALVTWPGWWDVQRASDLAQTLACLPICLLASTSVAANTIAQRADAAILDGNEVLEVIDLDIYIFSTYGFSRRLCSGCQPL